METKKQFKYAIGIDTGVHTGFAVWDIEKQLLLNCETMQIDEAMESVMFMFIFASHKDIIVVIEDARKRKFFKGENMAAKQQGAGSIKRDAKIWEDYLTRLKIPFKMVNPTSRKTKITEEYFKKISKYKGRTSNHARDAAMLVLGYKNL